ncbi:MAG: hypothetical protein Q7S98_03615, partial [Deltaproteobacteria bacterium]|nr:hypothetical protein [Deltaproteobacteria bacterium]
RVQFFPQINATQIVLPSYDPFAQPQFGGVQVLPPFEEDPGTPMADAEGLTLTTESATALPGTAPPDSTSAAAPVTTSGLPLSYDSNTDTSHLKLVTSITISADSTPPLGGTLAGELAGAALVADIEGTITNSQTGRPVRSLSDLRENCGAATASQGSALALSAQHSWDPSPEILAGNEGVALTGNATQGFAGAVNFRARPFTKRAGGEAAQDSYYTNSEEVRRRYQAAERIVVRNESTTEILPLTVRMTPDGGAFVLGDVSVPRLGPGESVTIPVSFNPGEGVAGCTNETRVCESVLTVSGNRMTLNLRGTGSERSGKLALSEVSKDLPSSCGTVSYGSDCGPVLALPAVADQRTDYGTVLQNTCKSKVFRVSNVGVLDAAISSLPLSDSTAYFTRGQVRRGGSFATAVAISGTAMGSVGPLRTNDLFFYLRYCPTSSSNDNGEQSQYTVGSPTGSFSFHIKGKVDKRTDAIAQVYISDFEDYSGATGGARSCDKAPKPADLIAPNGKCLYRVTDLSLDQNRSLQMQQFSFRANATARDVYIVNGKARAGADTLRVIPTELPANIAGRDGDFEFVREVSLFTIPPTNIDLPACPERAGSGGTRCRNDIPCVADNSNPLSPMWCKKIGVLSFRARSTGTFGIVSHDFVVRASSVKSTGQVRSFPTVPDYSVNLQGANGAPRSEKTLHIARVFAGFDPPLSGPIGIASSLTPGQVAAAGVGASRIDRFAVRVLLDPQRGEITLPGVFTPILADRTQRSSEGISLFNPSGSAATPGHYLYSFQCSGPDCRYFSAYLANRCLLYRADQCAVDNNIPPSSSYDDTGSGGFYGRYGSINSEVRALDPVTRASDFQTILREDSSSARGFYDPVTGEVSFRNNLVLRLFSPDNAPFRSGRPSRDADVTIELSLTTECVESSIVPLRSQVSSGSYPLNIGRQNGHFEGGGVESGILDPIADPGIINTFADDGGSEHYGPNPLPAYVTGAEAPPVTGVERATPSNCTAGLLHGRRLWIGTGHENNIDNTATLDKLRPASGAAYDVTQNRFQNPNFDLAGVGFMKANQVEADSRVIYLVIKACLGDGAGESPGTGACFR